MVKGPLRSYSKGKTIRVFVADLAGSCGIDFAHFFSVKKNADLSSFTHYSGSKFILGHIRFRFAKFTEKKEIGKCTSFPAFYT